MTEKPPKTRLPDNFASFTVDHTQPGRRKPRWSINPLRAEAHASAEGARLSSLAAEITRGIGRTREGRE
jgi:hypothetical protein